MNRLGMLGVIALVVVLAGIGAGIAKLAQPRMYHYVGQVQAVSGEDPSFVYLELVNVTVDGSDSVSEVDANLLPNKDTLSLQIGNVVYMSCMANFFNRLSPDAGACNFGGVSK